MSEPACQLDRHPLAAAHYADCAVQQHARIEENVLLARDTYRIRLESPEIAARIVPGQFVMLRLPAQDDPLLARPFALYDTWLDDAGQPRGIDVVYLVIGKMTSRLADCVAGQQLEVWGPLGNGFSAVPARRLIFVAGGIGQTPFLALGRERLGGRNYGATSRKISTADQVTFCYGVRSAEYLAGLDDFAEAGIETRVSTDDGSAGLHGLVTELLTAALAESPTGECRVACCGPEPMMAAVAAICRDHGTPCEASLETPMACGIGICFSCVAKIMQPDGQWDYKRTCVEGPVFDAEKIVW